METQRVADGIRTHDLRNHNPNEPGSNIVTGQQVTSSDAAACTNACTSLAENAHDGPAEVVERVDLRRLELLAAEPELLSAALRGTLTVDQSRQLARLLTSRTNEGGMDQ